MCGQCVFSVQNIPALRSCTHTDASDGDALPVALCSMFKAALFFMRAFTPTVLKNLSLGNASTSFTGPVPRHFGEVQTTAAAMIEPHFPRPRPIAVASLALTIVTTTDGMRSSRAFQTHILLFEILFSSKLSAT